MVTIPPISVDDWGMVYGIPVLTFMGRSMGISMVIIFHNIGIMGRSNGHYSTILPILSQYYPNKLAEYNGNTKISANWSQTFHELRDLM